MPELPQLSRMKRSFGTHHGAIVLEKPKEYDIRKSMEKIGSLYPILKSLDGKIIDGMHRKNADKNWPEVEVNIEGNQVLVARIVANMQRRKVSKEEKTDLLKELAEATHWTPEQISENTGMSISWVRKYLSSNYKNKKMAQLARKKRKKARVAPAKEVITCPDCRSNLILVYVCPECGHMTEKKEA
jgi:ParB-like chromosome segregation protein Spo0J